MLIWILRSARAEPSDDIEEITVEGERAPETATGRELDREHIQALPARSADEMLRAMPGMQLSSHGGTGKAFQFLVRGFDADHGADIAVTVEGVPINEPSNIHGQGYIDLHFLPSLLVDSLSLTKGSYRAEDGDFAIVGSAEYRTGLTAEGLTLQVSSGTDRSASGTAAYRPAGAPEGSFLLAEGEGGLGVGEGRRYQQVRAAAGLEAGDARRSVRGMLFAYTGDFESPGVLRADDIDAERISFYGAYPEAGGGSSDRLLGVGTFAASSPAGGSLDAVLWAGARALTLDQNFSGYLRDATAGDGTRQSERALDGGAKIRLGTLLGERASLRGGADLHAVAVDMREDALGVDGALGQTNIDTDARHVDLGLWGEGRLQPSKAVSIVPGLRVDRLWLASLDRIDELLSPVEAPSWARSGALVPAPRIRASLEPTPALTLFGAAGRGTRSPPARGLQDGDLAAVVRSDSAEIGALASPARALSFGATGFGIVLGNELIFDHLAGRFLSAGRTRRVGVETVADLRPARWLHLQGDLTFTDARFVADGSPIPYAPRVLGSASAYLLGAHLARAKLTGGLRVTGVGQRPLPSGFASHPALTGSLTARASWERLSIGAEVDNLFGGRWRDGEWVYPSWFDTQRPRSELKVLHVTAGDPFAVRISLGVNL